MQVGRGPHNRGLIIKRKEAGHHVWSVTLSLSHSQKHFLAVSPTEQEDKVTYSVPECGTRDTSLYCIYHHKYLRSAQRVEMRGFVHCFVVYLGLVACAGHPALEEAEGANDFVLL